MSHFMGEHACCVILWKWDIRARSKVVLTGTATLPTGPCAHGGHTVIWPSSVQAAKAQSPVAQPLLVHTILLLPAQLLARHLPSSSELKPSGIGQPDPYIRTRAQRNWSHSNQTEQLGRRPSGRSHRRLVVPRHRCCSSSSIRVLARRCRCSRYCEIGSSRSTSHP